MILRLEEKGSSADTREGTEHHRIDPLLSIAAAGVGRDT